MNVFLQTMNLFKPTIVKELISTNAMFVLNKIWNEEHPGYVDKAPFRYGITADKFCDNLVEIIELHNKRIDRLERQLYEIRNKIEG